MNELGKTALKSIVPLSLTGWLTWLSSKFVGEATKPVELKSQPIVMSEQLKEPLEQKNVVHAPAFSTQSEKLTLVGKTGFFQ